MLQPSVMPPHPAIRKIFFAVLVGSFAYAIIRYNILKGVEWSQLPLFITNKAISLAAVILIALSYITSRTTRDKTWPCWTGFLGYALAAAHTIASLILLAQPGYYPKFLGPNQTLNLIGNLSLISGILAFVGFTCTALVSLPGIRDALSHQTWKTWQKPGIYAFWLTLSHVLIMGWNNWLKISTWPGFLPPITLLAGLIILATLIFRAWNENSRESSARRSRQTSADSSRSA